MRHLIGLVVFCTCLIGSPTIQPPSTDQSGWEVRLGNSAIAQPLPDKPLIVSAADGHLSLIKGIAFTPDGRQLVSASQDKTIRVWDTETGQALRTIRGEIAPGTAGRIDAMALSPDGR